MPVAAARAAHDQLPPGVESLPTLVPDYWQQRRRKPVASDRALTGTAIAWLLAVPEPLRPTLLSERHPRVVNAIAEAWPGAERLAFLESLLVDKRGNRVGFGAELRNEIEMLYDWAARSAARRFIR